jgi:RHS repeat-associated protein
MTTLAIDAIEALSRPAATDSYDYDAFGNEFTVSGMTPDEMMYRGEQYDSDLGLYYLRARYMNPLSGRFMSRDAEPGDRLDPKTMHRYLYAGGDSIDMVDPTGRFFLEIPAWYTFLSGLIDKQMAKKKMPAEGQATHKIISLIVTCVVGLYDDLSTTIPAVFADPTHTNATLPTRKFANCMAPYFKATAPDPPSRLTLNWAGYLRTDSLF